MSQPLFEKNSVSETATNPEKKWYKQFWPWFIFGLPALVVIASFVTLYIAIIHRDEMVDDHCIELRSTPQNHADRLPCYAPHKSAAPQKESVTL
jgi:hypothetical protein